MGIRQLTSRIPAPRLRGIVATGTRIYLALAILQFMLGLLFGAGLVLLDYDFAGVVALLRELE